MSTTFDDVLSAVEHLPADQQAELIELVQRRLAQLGRDRVATDVRDGRAEFQAGQNSSTQVSDLMREIQS